MTIEVNFDDINIEYGGVNCYYDYLRIYDGVDDKQSTLGKFCGQSLPATIKSSSNKIYLHFHSDDRQTYTGFKLTWRAVGNNVVTTLSPINTEGTHFHGDK